MGKVAGDAEMVEETRGEEWEYRREEKEVGLWYLSIK